MSEIYCRLDAYKRLTQEGHSPSEAWKIIDEVWSVVKNGQLRNNEQCGCRKTA